LKAKRGVVRLAAHRTPHLDHLLLKLMASNIYLFFVCNDTKGGHQRRNYKFWRQTVLSASFNDDLLLQQKRNQ